MIINEKKLRKLIQKTIRERRELGAARDIGMYQTCKELKLDFIPGGQGAGKLAASVFGMLGVPDEACRSFNAAIAPVGSRVSKIVTGKKLVYILDQRIKAIKADFVNQNFGATLSLITSKGNQAISSGAPFVDTSKTVIGSVNSDISRQVSKIEDVVKMLDTANNPSVYNLKSIVTKLFPGIKVSDRAFEEALNDSQGDKPILASAIQHALQEYRKLLKFSKKEIVDKASEYTTTGHMVLLLDGDIPDIEEAFNNIITKI